MWFFTGATKKPRFLGKIPGNKIAEYIVILADIVKLVNLEIVTTFQLRQQRIK